MSDIKLFRTNADEVTQLEGHSVALEKSLQSLMEKNLDVFLGIRFLATEHSTGKTHGGRIDTLGIDENGCPCIIEYKRSSNENVINQGLYYLDWLLDHKGAFELLVLKSLGQESADAIEWSSPRLLCIAGNFTKYDGHAVQQINRNIELIKYVRYGDEFLLLDRVNSVQATSSPDRASADRKPDTPRRTVADHIKEASAELTDLFEQLKATCMGFGDDVEMKILKQYVAFRRLKNFASANVRATSGQIVLYVKVNPDQIELEEGFTRDVRSIGIWGTGDLEILIRNQHDLERALPYLQMSYEAS